MYCRSCLFSSSHFHRLHSFRLISCRMGVRMIYLCQTLITSVWKQSEGKLQSQLNYIETIQLSWWVAEQSKIWGLDQITDSDMWMICIRPSLLGVCMHNSEHCCCCCVSAGSYDRSELFLSTHGSCPWSQCALHPTIQKFYTDNFTLQFQRKAYGT